MYPMVSIAIQPLPTYLSLHAHLTYVVLTTCLPYPSIAITCLPLTPNLLRVRVKITAGVGQIVHPLSCRYDVVLGR